MDETSKEYGIEHLIPSFSTNPDFPPGQPFADCRVEWNFPTRERAVAVAESYGLTDYRVMVRTVTPWEPDNA
jgi:hypothetical protein